jgi:hypothetical protein
VEERPFTAPKGPFFHHFFALKREEHHVHHFFALKREEHHVANAALKGRSSTEIKFCSEFKTIQSYPQGWLFYWSQP